MIKVGDFGLSENMYTTNYIRLVKEGKQPSVRLPVKWMALESLVDGIFSEKTDVVSVILQKISSQKMLQSHRLVRFKMTVEPLINRQTKGCSNI